MKGFLMTLAILSSIAHARTWTDIKGRKIEGEFVRQDAESTYKNPELYQWLLSQKKGR